MTCPADYFAADQKTSFVDVACKCPNMGNAGCAWYHRSRLANYENYTCNQKMVASTGQGGDGSETGYGSDGGNTVTTG